MGPVKRTDRCFRQRYLAKYPDHADDGPQGMKVDIHFRHAPKRRDIEFVNGIRSYRAEAIIDQKMAAARSRIKPLDVLDIAFVLESYGGGSLTARLNEPTPILRTGNACESGIPPSSMGMRFPRT